MDTCSVNQRKRAELLAGQAKQWVWAGAGAGTQAGVRLLHESNASAYVFVSSWGWDSKNLVQASRQVALKTMQECTNKIDIVSCMSGPFETVHTLL